MTVHVPENRQGWWGGPDRRPRCLEHDKVAFETRERAQRSADGATLRGTPMSVYRANCGSWHVARARR